MRTTIVETPAEFAAVGHLRGWCHDSSACPICAVQLRAREAEARLDSVITGSWGGGCA